LYKKYIKLQWGKPDSRRLCIIQLGGPNSKIPCGSKGRCYISNTCI